jgi:hypothetical protein
MMAEHLNLTTKVIALPGLAIPNCSVMLKSTLSKVRNSTSQDKYISRHFNDSRHADTPTGKYFHGAV